MVPKVSANVKDKPGSSLEKRDIYISHSGKTMEPRLPLARPSNLSAPHLLVWIQKPFLQGCIQRPQLPETQRQQQQKRNIQRRHISIRFQTQLFPTIPITSSPPPQTELRGPDPADIGHLRGRDSYLWNSLTIDAMSPPQGHLSAWNLATFNFLPYFCCGKAGEG